jgi:hypothetical protein
MLRPSTLLSIISTICSPATASPLAELPLSPTSAACSSAPSPPSSMTPPGDSSTTTHASARTSAQTSRLIQRPRPAQPSNPHDLLEFSRTGAACLPRTARGRARAPVAWARFSPRSCYSLFFQKFGTSAEMCDRENLNHMQHFPIEDYEWESPKRELPSSMFTGGPALR